MNGQWQFFTTLLLASFLVSCETMNPTPPLPSSRGISKIIRPTATLATNQCVWLMKLAEVGPKLVVAARSGGGGVRDRRAPRGVRRRA